VFVVFFLEMEFLFYPPLVLGGFIPGTGRYGMVKEFVSMVFREAESVRLDTRVDIKKKKIDLNKSHIHIDFPFPGITML